MKLLHLDSGITGSHSASRQLSTEIVARQRKAHPNLEIVYHDLAAEPVQHLSPAHLAAWQGAVVNDPDLGRDLSRGGAYIDELLAADVIVIGAPMYNFTIPTQLKAWFDRVLVAGKTFKYTDKGAVGLVPEGKKVYVASSRGGVYSPGSPAAVMDHHETYMLGALAFMGLTDVTLVRAEGIAMGPQAREAALENARGQIEAMAV